MVGVLLKLVGRQKGDQFLSQVPQAPLVSQGVRELVELDELGYLLLVYNADLKIAAVFALLVILAAIGLVLHAVVRLVQRRVMFWVEPPDRAMQP